MTLMRSRRDAGLPARRVLRLSCAAVCLLAGPVFPAAAQTEKKGESIVLTDELMQSQSSPEAHARVIRWLREVIDPNSVQDGAGNTVMHYVATNTPDILATAIDRGGDCNRRNAHGASPLHFAAAQTPLFGPGPRSIRLLVKCGADPDLRDRRGAAPLHAVYLGVERSGALPIWALNSLDGGLRVDVLKALLESGADPGVEDGNGDTPLMMAVKEFGADIELSPRRAHLRLLVEHGADPDARDKAGATPLILAVTFHARKRGDTAETIIRRLIALGADPDLDDRAGDTALIRAAKIDEHDSLAAIRALLAGGADPCLADRAGKLPYDHAAEGSSQRELLDKAGGGRDWETRLCVREIRATAEAEKKLGLGKEARSRIQSCLKGAGFDPGSADGAFGSRTRAALRGWQAKQGRKGAAAAGYLTKADAAALLACTSAPSPVCAGKAGAACWMEAANRPGCHLWNPYPQPEETVTWSGACVDGKASGKGESAWRFREDGEWKTSSDRGEYRDGRVSDGHRISRFSNGETWEGPFTGGKGHGVWVRRGSGGRDLACRRDGERVDDSRCVGGDDRSMRAVRATAVGSGPGVDYESVGRLQAGDKVKVTGKAGDWLRVALSDGKAGFVPASVLEEAKGPEAGSTFRDCAECPEMVVVPAGSFAMGSPPSEEGRGGDEGPVHRVTISEPFAVGVYEVTFSEWDACVSAGGCGGHRPADQGWGRGNRPVINVNWDDAQSYARWLSEKTGADYRLLSEAEWEYAARAGTTTRYWWGDGIGRNRANCVGCGSRWNNRQTAPVGSFGANGFGLHDVHGNVWEWVADCWNASYAGAPSDGSAWKSGNCSWRVLRGGAWLRPGLLRSAYRSRNVTGFRYLTVGFRVSRTLAP